MERDGHLGVAQIHALVQLYDCPLVALFSEKLGGEDPLWRGIHSVLEECSDYDLSNPLDRRLLAERLYDLFLDGRDA